MNTVCVRKLVLSLLCIFCLTSGLASTAKEHKTSEHKQVSQTSPSENKGTSNSSSSADGDSKKTATEPKELTPDATFEVLRQTTMKHLLEYKASPDHPLSAKLVESLKPTLTKYFNVPLVLKDKTVNAGSAILTYQSADPKIDLSVTVLMVPSGNTWTISSWQLKGQQGVELQTELLKDLTDTFPTQFTLMWVFIFAILAIGLVHFCAAIWLDVVAFKTSLGWGFATLLLPGAGIVFAILNWQVAKKPFLTVMASVVATFLTFLIPVWVGYSLGDVTSSLGEFSPKPAASPAHEI